MASANDFFKIAKNGRASELLRLIEDGVGVDSRNVQGDTALMLASYFGNFAVVKLLLEHGAKTNAQNNTGQTALMYACNRKHTEIAKLLLKYHADPDLTDESSRDAYQWTPGGNPAYLRSLADEVETGRSELKRYGVEDDAAIPDMPKMPPQPISLTEADDETFGELGAPVASQVQPITLTESDSDFEEIGSPGALPTESLELEEDRPQTTITPQAATVLMKNLHRGENQPELQTNKIELPPISRIPEKREEMQILHAVRMNWLRWLARPFVFIWKGIVWLFMYFWSLVVIAWKAMIESFRVRYWLIAAAGIAIAALFTGVMWLLATLLKQQFLLYVASGVGILPIMWASGEIASQVCCRLDNVNSETISEVTSKTGNGLRVMTFFLLFVLFQALAGGILIGFNLTKYIPEVGGVVQSVFIIPALVVAGFAVFNTITILFSSAVLPGHLLHYEKEDASGLRNLTSLFGSVLKVIRKKWLRIILLLPSTLFFGVLSSIPVLLLCAACIAIAAAGPAVMGGTQIEVATLWTNFMASISGWKGITSAVMVIIAASAVAGAALSVVATNLTVSYYFLYKEVRKPIIKKN